MTQVFSLEGRRALVTGGHQGLGAAFSEAMALAGAEVVVTGRNSAAGTAFADRLGAQTGRSVSWLDLDVTDPGSVRDAFGRAWDSVGPIDVVINNAGICIHRPTFEVPDEEFGSVLDVNVQGVWRVCREAGRRLVDAGLGGAIVNIGSISGFIVNRPQWQASYNASKAAVHQLTRSLAVEWAPHGIRVNAIAPGYVRTAMAPVDDPQFHRYWIDDAPQQRAAAPAEIAPTAVYLASAAGSFVTGSVITIDGGYSLV